MLEKAHVRELGLQVGSGFGPGGHCVFLLGLGSVSTCASESMAGLRVP
jgi:hypothetical protein